jgi:hypothetical protein
MIITNWIAALIVFLAGCNVPGTVGVTIWPFIFIHPAKYAEDIKVVLHETCHLEQYKRYFIIGFPIVYGYQYLKYGYWDMPLEVEARKAANER